MVVAVAPTAPCATGANKCTGQGIHSAKYYWVGDTKCKCTGLSLQEEMGNRGPESVGGVLFVLLVL